VRCRIVNVKDDGTIQVVPKHAAVIGKCSSELCEDDGHTGPRQGIVRDSGSWIARAGAGMSIAATGALSQSHAWLVMLIVAAVAAFNLVDR
jgi:hypothetical protein